MTEQVHTPEGKKQPTASEAMFFYAIVKHTKNRADIDWDGVAREQGFKNAEVAKVRFPLSLSSSPSLSLSHATHTRAHTYILPEPFHQRVKPKTDR